MLSVENGKITKIKCIKLARVYIVQKLAEEAKLANAVVRSKFNSNAEFLLH